MAADYPLSEKVKNDTEVTADLAIFVAVVRRDKAAPAARRERPSDTPKNSPPSKVAKRT
jgi:hypothetical protein